jgi:DNA-binding NtrC family response regulator
MKNIFKLLGKPSNKFRITLLDDDKIATATMKRRLQKDLAEAFKGKEFEFQVFHEPDKAFMDSMETTSPEFLLLDYHIVLANGKEVLGINVLKKMQKEYPATNVIMLTSEDRLETAINLMREGAYDFVLKSESAIVNLVKAIGRKVSLFNMEHNARRNRIFIKMLISVWILTMVALLVVATLFPAK